MAKENAGKSILAAALCGVALYMTGQALSLLFRDVDPKRIEKTKEDEADAIGTGDEAEDPGEDAPETPAEDPE